MKSFFEHLFYRIYWWNTRIVNNSGSPIFPTLLGISIFHIINISSLVILSFLLFGKDMSNYPKWLHVSGMVLVLLIDYFIYIHGGRFRMIVERVKNKPEAQIKRNDIMTIIYIALSFGLLIYVVLEMRTIMIV
jgi:hypothetical protein